MTDQKKAKTKEPAATRQAAGSPPVEAAPIESRPEVEPHPSSSHRTPEEIAKEEAGPVGPSAEAQAASPRAPAVKAPSKEDEHIRAAVQRSAHPGGKPAARRAAADPARRSGKR